MPCYGECQSERYITTRVVPRAADGYRHPHVDEIFTRASALPSAKAAPTTSTTTGGGVKRDAAQSAFAGAKRTEGGDQVYIAVGRSDASLVDADSECALTLPHHR